jgi:hypothetical protein
MTHALDKAVFLRDFAKELVERKAVLFAGAGLSIPAGMVNWKDLLREVASDLQLDIDREDDLISIAQFHFNVTGNRSKINQQIIDEFDKLSSLTDNHVLIATLPFEIIWTTNYDSLIEDSLRRVGKRPEVKHSTSQLSGRVRGADATIFKMHGDKTLPDEAVITRDDYEDYGKHRQLFAEMLQGDLVSHTFLFLGFSFTDPNIDYILSRVRILMGKNRRTHYCVMRRPKEPDNPTGTERADYEYEVRKLELRMQDLKRYGIQTVLIDEFAEITDMLRDLNKAAHSREVFVSGSAHTFDPLGQDKVEEICRLLGKQIIEAHLNLVNGFGLGIGGTVAMGAIEAVYGTLGERLEERVLLRPFPQDQPKGMTRAQLWTRYRNEMIAQAGHAVFLCGNKLDVGSGSVVEANGVREEFEISKALGKTLIPIGATGHVAKHLWEEMNGDLNTYFPGIDVSSEFATLGNESASATEIVEATLRIISKARQ